MKHKNADITKNNDKKPVKENQPVSIANDLENEEKKGYPFPEEKDKQLKNQPEFLDPGNNSSKNE